MNAPVPVLTPDLRELLARHGDDAVREVERRLATAARACLVLRSERVGDAPLRRGGLARLLGRRPATPLLPPLASKWGGAPYDEIADRPWDELMFLGQLDLAALPPVEGIPRRGVLALDRGPSIGGFRVRWFPDASPERVRGPAQVPCVGAWEAKIVARPGWSLPEGEAWDAFVPAGDDELRDAWGEWIPDGFGEDLRDECHRAFGHRSAGLDEPYDLEGPLDAYEQLWRITFDNVADFGWGTNWIYVVIHRDDLAAGRLDRAIVTGANS